MLHYPLYPMHVPSFLCSALLVTPMPLSRDMYGERSSYCSSRLATLVIVMVGGTELVFSPEKRAREAGPYKFWYLFTT